MRNYQIVTRNCHSAINPAAPMYLRDVNALLAVFDATLDYICPNIIQGTFILDGQKWGEEAQCILRFNMPQGDWDNISYAAANGITDRMAEDSIDEILAMPDESRYTYGRAIAGTIKSANDVRSGIWQEDELQAMVLNTVFGRFIMSCHLADADEMQTEVTEVLLYAMAQVIMRMSEEDVALQAFSDYLHTTVLCSPAKCAVGNIVGFVNGLFTAFRLPELQYWDSRHTGDRLNGELPLFFE